MAYVTSEGIELILHQQPRTLNDTLFISTSTSEVRAPTVPLRQSSAPRSRIQKIKLQSTTEDDPNERSIDGWTEDTINHLLSCIILAQTKTCKGKNKRVKAFHEHT